MTILEQSPYILGIEHTRTSVSPMRIDTELFNEIANMVERSYSAKDNLNNTVTPKKFFEVEEDIAYYVPRELQEDMFYSLKNGYLVDEAPAKVIFYMKEAYSKYSLPNLIFKQISDKDLQVFFQSNYLSPGFTYRDVICSLFNSDYTPLSDRERVVRYSDFSEVYISRTDMVAAIPNQIVDKLSRSDIHKIDVDKNGLNIDGTYLRTLGGLYGASNSIYDLRECL